MKFFDSKNNSSIYQNVFNEVDYTDFPFKNIILKKDYQSLSLIATEEIPFEATTQIKINVNKVGSIILFFKLVDFNRENFTSEISKLGEINSNTIADVIFKVRTVYQIAKRYNVLFSIYTPRGDYILFEDCYNNLVGDVITFYVHNIDFNEVDNYRPPIRLFKKHGKEKPAPKPQPKPVEDRTYEPEHKEVDKKDRPKKEKLQFTNPFKVLQKDKFHYLFGFVAAFLIGFTISVSIYDMYLGNTIYIFFLICSLAGMFLNALIYRDTLNSKSIKSTEFILDVAMSLVGWAVSIGGYFIFVAITKEKVNTNNFMILMLQLAGIAVSGAIGYLLAYLKKKRA